MKILISCEESQAVCKEFRKLGHEAYSCDILDCSGGHPEWHIKNDVIEVINGGGYDMMIAFPPCTHLTVSGARHFEQKRKDGRQQQGIDFFMSMINAPIEKIAVENPIGIMSSIYKKPSQIIQPYYFGDPFQKTTCLWLKNLKPLYYNLEPNLFDSNVTSTKDKGEMIYWIDKKTGKQKSQAKWYYDALINAKTKEERSTLRSKTFPGIAKAMATQWG
jgi:site-specific DNA-cytosine methylase